MTQNSTLSNSNKNNKMSNLENAMKELANQTNDIFIIFYFTAGLLVILIIFWLLYKINEGRFLSQRQLQNIDNYIENIPNQVLPPSQFGQRDLGNGFVEYDIENCIFVQGDVQQYTNRYEVVLIKSSDDEDGRYSSATELSDSFA